MAPAQFIVLHVRNAITVHGYNADNQEIVQRFEDEAFVEKIIAVSRIQSVSEQYLLVTGSHGRLMYWEYQGDLQSVKALLMPAGGVVG